MTTPESDAESLTRAPGGARGADRHSPVIVAVSTPAVGLRVAWDDTATDEQGYLVSDQPDADQLVRRLHRVLRSRRVVTAPPGAAPGILDSMFARIGLPARPWAIPVLDLSTYAAGALGYPIQHPLSLRRLCELLGVSRVDLSVTCTVDAVAACMRALRDLGQDRRTEVRSE
jgi:hypothetical protein